MKKEKYIRVTKNASGNKIIRIEISAYDQTYRKTLNLKEFVSEREAMEVAKQIRNEKLTEMQRGYTVKNLKTVGAIYNRSYELIPVRQKTIKRHKCFYVAIKPYEDTRIEKITAADIQMCINQYARTHTKRQVRGLLAIWRRIYRTALLLNIAIPDRSAQVLIPECVPDQPKKKEISAADLETFLEVLEKYNARTDEGYYNSKCIYYAIQIMRYCGLRPAETLALTKNDIFTNGNGSGYISINKAAHSTLDSMLELGATKTKKSVRMVPIPADLAPILKECLKWSKHDLIFADYHGNLQSIDTVSDYVHRVSKKAGVQFNLYMLRHQFSTDLFASGTNPAVIRDLMGHTSSTMSLDYAVSSEAERIQALDKRKMN